MQGTPVSWQSDTVAGAAVAESRARFSWEYNIHASKVGLHKKVAALSLLADSLDLKCSIQMHVNQGWNAPPRGQNCGPFARQNENHFKFYLI